MSIDSWLAIVDVDFVDVMDEFTDYYIINGCILASFEAAF
jgi:hypothetical protein